MDGAFTPWREAKLHVLNPMRFITPPVCSKARGCYDGTIFALRQHTERM
jgi:branched-subunit amino acid aminotransferase/4-amino-4-deoxychorismate lyase